MYLSRVDLNPTRIVTRRMLANPNVGHALVEGAVTAPGGSRRSAGRALWRLDRDPGGRLTLYVVSASEPDFTGVIEQAAWPTRGTWRTAPYGPLLDRLGAGQEWRFRLTANPTVTEGRPGGRGKVRPLRTVPQQEQWLMHRQKAWGIEVAANTLGQPQVEVTARQSLSFTRREAREGGHSGRVQLSTATFNGLLRVTDPDALRTVLVQGAGRAKGYGCGLLTLAPTRVAE
jgi:CRISPR system Cascade subunit CasE